MKKQKYRDNFSKGLPVMQIFYENIPAELKSLPAGSCWRFEQRGGKATKVPYTPQAGEQRAMTLPRGLLLTSAGLRTSAAALTA